MKLLMGRICCLFIILSATTVGSAELQSLKFEMLGVGCTKESRCLATIYLEPKFFNEKDMKDVATQLSLQFKDKAVINADIFDDKELALAHLTNKAEPQGRQHDRRGWYARYESQEVLLFRPDKKRRGKFIRINLKGEV